ncbi:DNA gyrase inhibitory protein [Klebsiella pneumoniae]|nr:DNA gyrase inhibitory protein [Klebsiella pneumoniae]VAP16319.1 DNA gyrase inhibitory protein [Klebsiella pneumoniae]
MNYSITTLGKKTIAGFHLVGPWDHTVKQGFEQLMMWVENHQVPAREWVAVYYDNPEEVPAEKLRCATAVTVDEDYIIPANSEGVILAAIARPRAGGGLRLRHPVDAVF